MVITPPMPSMPVKFWNDPDGQRYSDTYFSMFPEYGATATGSRSPNAAASSSPDARTPPSTGTVSAWAAPTSTTSSTASPRWPNPWSSVPNSRAADTGCRCSSCWLPALFLMMRCGRGSLEICERRPRRGMCPMTSSPCPRSPTPRTGRKLEVPVKRLDPGACPREGGESRCRGFVRSADVLCAVRRRGGRLIESSDHGRVGSTMQSGRLGKLPRPDTSPRADHGAVSAETHPRELLTLLGGPFLSESCLG